MAEKEIFVTPALKKAKISIANQNRNGNRKVFGKRSRGRKVGKCYHHDILLFES